MKTPMKELTVLRWIGAGAIIALALLLLGLAIGIGAFGDLR